MADDQAPPVPNDAIGNGNGPPRQDELAPPQENGGGGNDRGLGGGSAMRPIWFGNLMSGYTSVEDIKQLFERPPNDVNDGKGLPVDRVELKRGFCFVFLPDARSEDDKQQAERFVQDINGKDIPNVSRSIRAEFARGDGRIRRKEEDRRRNIVPSETLFVVNFSPDTTKHEDLRMLFEPYGELKRIEMKRNYAFVEFGTIEEATRAKEEVHGGTLDQSVLTVEYVAQRGDRRRDYRRDGYRSDYRGGGGGGGGGSDYHRGGGRDRYNDRHNDRYNDRYDRNDRRRSPPQQPYRRRSRSRSRSQGHRRETYNDDRRRGPDVYERRAPDREQYESRGDRGYRP